MNDVLQLVHITLFLTGFALCSWKFNAVFGVWFLVSTYRTMSDTGQLSVALASNRRNWIYLRA